MLELTQTKEIKLLQDGFRWVDWMECFEWGEFNCFVTILTSFTWLITNLFQTSKASNQINLNYFHRWEELSTLKTADHSTDGQHFNPLHHNIPDVSKPVENTVVLEFVECLFVINHPGKSTGKIKKYNAIWIRNLCPLLTTPASKSNLSFPFLIFVIQFLC